MDISGYVEQLRTDLRAAAEAGGDEAMARSADRLVAALDAGMRLALLEALSDAAAEITNRLDGPIVEVRLKGREPQFVITSPPDVPAMPPPPAPTVDEHVDAEDGDGSTARITLRLPDGLKARAEEAAARSRQSLNTWLVDAVRAATTTPMPPATPGSARAGTQLSGWAR